MSELTVQLKTLAEPRQRGVADLEYKLREPAAGACPGLILIGLARIAEVDDTLGRQATTTLVHLAARRIRATLREGDSVWPLDNDEFAIVLTGPDSPERAGAVARCVLDVVARPFLVAGQTVNIHASAGIVARVDRDADAQSLLKRAGLALREARAAGVGEYRVFEPELERRALDRRDVEAGLRRALSLKQLEMRYQPQIGLADGRITGYEALMRWHVPGRGRIAPARFIPVAEETGLIESIGAWAVQQACRDARSWRDAGRIAVNISPVQLQTDAIVDVVRDALAASGLAPQRLDLEITEGVLLRNTDSVLERLWAIRRLGVGIAMDDFGTGYSSLSYLSSFPFSKVKVDRAFVRAPRDAKSQALVRAVVALAHGLEMSTIAEGVETPQQLEALAALGCTEVQGFLIAKPMPQADVDAFARAYRAAPPPGGVRDAV